MSGKFKQHSSRNWWENLDNLWQKIFIFNLGVELDLGGLSSHINKPGFNFTKLESLYGDGAICSWFKIGTDIPDDTIDQIINLETLIISNSEVIDITPLSIMNNLKTLDCSHNKISDITPLKNLIKLQDLNASFNQISSVEPLTNLKQLRRLVLMMNNILDFEPISDLENLEEFSCLFNFDSNPQLIFHLSSKWSKLKYLSAHSISDIQNLPLYYPDLVSLYVQGLAGDLSTINKLKMLKSLYISSNQLINLDSLVDLTELKSLVFSRNKIESIVPLKYLNKLEHLNFDFNQIKDLSPLLELKNLKFLECRNNCIESIEPLKSLRNLELLDFSNDSLYSKHWLGNNVSSLSSLKNLTNLKRIICRNNPLSPGELVLFKALHPNCEIIF